MTTDEFTSTILNHRTGFVINSGDANGDCYPSCGMNTMFFDGTSLTKSTYDSTWLNFFNEKSKGLGEAYVYLGDVKKITERSGDYLNGCYQISVQRLFEVEMEDEQNAKTVCTIGLV